MASQKAILQARVDLIRVRTLRARLRRLQARIRTLKADWDESKHPRDSDGKFTSGGGGAGQFLSDEEREKLSNKYESEKNWAALRDLYGPEQWAMYMDAIEDDESLHSEITEALEKADAESPDAAFEKPDDKKQAEINKKVDSLFEQLAAEDESSQIFVRPKSGSEYGKQSKSDNGHWPDYYSSEPARGKFHSDNIPDEDKESIRKKYTDVWDDTDEIKWAVHDLALKTQILHKKEAYNGRTTKTITERASIQKEVDMLYDRHYELSDGLQRGTSFKEGISLLAQGFVGAHPTNNYNDSSDASSSNRYSYFSSSEDEAKGFASHRGNDEGLSIEEAADALRKYREAAQAGDDPGEVPKFVFGVATYVKIDKAMSDLHAVHTGYDMRYDRQSGVEDGYRINMPQGFHFPTEFEHRLAYGTPIEDIKPSLTFRFRKDVPPELKAEFEEWSKWRNVPIEIVENTF